MDACPVRARVCVWKTYVVKLRASERFRATDVPFRDTWRPQKRAGWEAVTVMSTDRFEAAVAWIAACGSLSELVDALHEAVAALGAAGGSLGVVDGSKIRQFARGFPAAVAEGYTTLAVDDPLPGPLALRTKAPQFLPDRSSTLDRFPAAAAIVDATDYGAAACLPLVTREGTLGYVAAHYRGEHDFDSAEMFLLRTLAATCA